MVMMDMMGHGPISDKKLIDDYLLPKISGKRVAGGGFCIHDADVYSDHPYNLARKHVTAGGKIWYFFSPTRYVGGKASRRPGCSRQRSWTVVGADGRKKGTWNPRRTKHVVHGSAVAGGYFRTLTYQETSPDGVVVRPGWMMVEYGVSDEYGGGELVLCKVYKSPANGAGSSDAPSTSRSASASLAGKRKADAVERPDEAPTTSSQRRRKEMDVDDDDAMSFAQTLESELMCYFGIDKDSPGGQDQPANAAVPPCPARPEGAAANDDDDDVMEISVEEFLCSSAPSSQPEKADVSADKLVVASSPELIDYYSDDEVLACPPMDDEYVERITSEPFEFLSDD
nr:unnamed protein product [Digitaria exilis]